jgi:hypothetical protein
MRDERKDLSPEAQELIRLAELEKDLSKFDVASAIQENPSLMKGLNEYMVWFGAHMEAVAESKKSAPAGHQISKLVRQLKKNNKNQTKK